MRKLCTYATGLFVYMASALAQPINAPPGPPIQCNATAIYDASTSGSTKIVTGVAGKVIYICGFTMMSGGASLGVKLQQGTGTNCGTGTTALTPAYLLTVGLNITESSNVFRGLS